ncbi:hypothetical protein [Clostridium perfringens]|nr:hypothetical protein [Clostridium perfringens]
MRVENAIRLEHITQTLQIDAKVVGSSRVENSNISSDFKLIN